MANTGKRGIRGKSVPGIIERFMERWGEQEGGLEFPGVVFSMPSSRNIDDGKYGDPLRKPKLPDFVERDNDGWEQVR